jgi:HAD superfamily hydrolase (TIGR01450 family)
VTGAAVGPLVRDDRGNSLGSCPTPLCDAYDAALYDLDGVLYLGAEPVPHAAASVAAATRAGMRSAFVTNNASRRPEVVAAQLTDLGIPAQPADVVTSAQASVRLLRERVDAGADVLVLGAAGLVDEVVDAGFHVVGAATEQVRAVVQGYGPDTGMRELSEAAIALRSGALWIAANTDATLPEPRGLVPGNGALVAALRVATGLEPLVAGKPEPALHLESVARVKAQRPLVIGDRLDTDVLGAIRGGADSLLVLTGVDTARDVIAAPAGTRPTYVSWDLRGLVAPQPDVVMTSVVMTGLVKTGALRAECDGAAASYDEGSLMVEGAGVGALRAACALAWQCADDGLSIDRVLGLEQ